MGAISSVLGSSAAAFVAAVVTHDPQSIKLAYCWSNSDCTWCMQLMARKLGPGVFASTAAKPAAAKPPKDTAGPTERRE